MDQVNFQTLTCHQLHAIHASFKAGGTSGSNNPSFEKCRQLQKGKYFYSFPFLSVSFLIWTVPISEGAIYYRIHFCFFKSILTLKYWLLELRSISFSQRISEAKARHEWKVDLIVKCQQNERYFQHCKIIQILDLNFRPLRPFKISIVVTKMNC